MFEILEHTADIGFRARGRTAAELFEAAAGAIVAIALEPENISPRAEYPLAASGADYESLLVNWLSEVLYWMDGERLAFHHFRVDEIAPNRVSGAGAGEPRDAERHHARVIVKGVTYHQLRVVQTPGDWCAEVYLDI
ncbi:MAG: archease [Acidobacteria bacterium]|nr:archease [Acidobacteriota bacterium]